MGITDDHIASNFQAFLQTYPEYKDTVRDVSHTLYRQVQRRGLPHNQDCLDFIQNALRFEENLSGDDYQVYQEITGYSEPCCQDTKEFFRSFQGFSLPPLNQQMAKAVSAHAVKTIQKESQGFTARTQESLINILARDHLEALAELNREATLFALLDEECAALNDIKTELAAEGLPCDLTPQQRYDTLLMLMSGQCAAHITG
ncbi:MAG TPA: hypothetical protein VGD95_01365, partial [Micavibrio sp.]